MISIGCLIYRSRKYADAVWNSAHLYTPHLLDGRARFFFVANDPTDEILEHLVARRYPHVVQRNEDVPMEELQRRGFAPPAYIHRVYRGWNRAIHESDERMVLVSSDNLFSPGWLDGLLRIEGPTVIASSKLVERDHPTFGVFPGAHCADFGSHPDEFDEEGFLSFCAREKQSSTERGYAYTPSMMSREAAMSAGMFPEGNLARPGKPLCGDKALFEQMAKRGVVHLTARDSLVYHFKEGEMSE